MNALGSWKNLPFLHREWLVFGFVLSGSVFSGFTIVQHPQISLFMLLVLFGMVFLAVSVRRNDAFIPLVLLIFIIPFDRLVVLSGFGSASNTGNTIMPLLGMGVFGIWILITTITHKRIKRFNERFLLIVFAVIVFLTTLVNATSLSDLISARTYAQLFIFTFLIVQIVDTPAKYKALVWAIIISNTMLALYTSVSGNIFVSRVSGTMEVEAYRAIGARGDPNFTAQQLLTALPFMTFFLLNAKMFETRLLLTISTFFLLTSVMLTQSLGGFIGLFFALTLIMMFHMHGDSQRFNHIVILMFSTFAAIYFIPNYVSDKAAEQLQLLSEHEQDRLEFGSGRTASWLASLRAMSSSPLFGTGPKKELQVIAQYDPLGRHIDSKAPHNAFLSVGTQVGVGGLIAFGVLVFGSLYKLYRAIRSSHGCLSWQSLGVSTWVSLSAFLLQSIALDSQYSKSLWLLIGMAIAYRLISENKNTEINEKG